jgi:hypothetical protein
MNVAEVRGGTGAARPGPARGKQGGPASKEARVDIYVNLEAGIATIRITRRTTLFDGPAQRFIISSDSGGFSAVEKREDGYYDVDYLRPELRKINERKITAAEAKRIIRETLKERYFLAVRG